MSPSTHYHIASAIDFRYRGIPLHPAVDATTPGPGLLNYSYITPSLLLMNETLLITFPGTSFRFQSSKTNSSFAQTRCKLIPWSRGPCSKFNSRSADEEIPRLLWNQGSLPCSQQRVTRPYQTNESNPQRHILLSRI
jgi:hypothetical protein